MKSTAAMEKKNAVGSGMVKRMPKEIEAMEKEGFGGSGITNKRNGVEEKGFGGHPSEREKSAGQIHLS